MTERGIEVDPEVEIGKRTRKRKGTVMDGLQMI
jgi:hypothetical protein